MDSERMVAVCDITGFARLVERSSLEQLVGTHLTFFRQALRHALHQDAPESSDLSLAALRQQSRVGIAWFSDTVIVYGLDDSDEACHNLIETIGWLIFETLVGTPSTKFRAGVAYGELHTDVENEMYVGKGLVEAYKVEREQEWTGGALSCSAKQRVSAATNPQLPTSGWWLTPYTIPVKGGPESAPVSDVAIDWTLGIHEPTHIPWSSESAEPAPGDYQERADVCRKWYNTRQFHRAMCRWCDKGQRQRSAGT